MANADSIKSSCFSDWVSRLTISQQELIVSVYAFGKYGLSIFTSMDVDISPEFQSMGQNNSRQYPVCAAKLQSCRCNIPSFQTQYIPPGTLVQTVRAFCVSSSHLSEQIISAAQDGIVLEGVYLFLDPTFGYLERSRFRGLVPLVRRTQSGL